MGDEMSIWGKLGVAIFVIAAALFIFMITWGFHEAEVACHEAGFVRSHGAGGINGCEDAGGNIHYVNMRMDGLFHMVATEISVGDVRVVTQK
jgi:hypothetical protein